MSVQNEPHVWRKRLLAGAAGLILIFLAFPMDGLVAAALKTLPGSGLQYFAGFLSKIGDWPCLVMVGILFSLLLYVRGRAECGRMLLVVLIAGMLAGFSATIVRSTVGRTRPSSHLKQGFYGPYHDSHWTVGHYEFGSFPSGHTATVAGLAAAFWMWRRRWGVLFAIFGAAVAWSRIALNCHHFSDVVAAIVWGFFMGSWLFSVIEPRFNGWWKWWPACKFVDAGRAALAKVVIPPA